MRYVQLWAGLAVLTSAGAALAAEITWAVVDWPPMFVTAQVASSGSVEDLGGGAVDQLMRQLIRRAPQHSHRIELLNRQRIWAAMEQGRNLCYAAALPSPEREKLAYLYPVTATPPIALVTTQAIRKNYLPGMNSLSWSDISKRLPQGGVLEAGRNYGEEIEKSLVTHGLWLERLTVSTTGALLRPLAAGRYHYTLEYPMVVSYENVSQFSGQVLHYVPLDGMRAWGTVYLACTRNAWGYEVMKDLSVAIRAAAATPQYRAVTRNWLDKDYYRRSAPYIREVFDRIAQNPPFQ